MALSEARKASQKTHFLLLFAICLLLANPLLAQQATEGHVGLPMDWSTRHILFTNGGTPEVRAAAAHDLRSWINWNQRSSFLFPRYGAHPGLMARRKRHPRIDWAMSLGPGTGNPANGGLAVGESPAKYSFNINNTYSCANDYVVYTIGATPSATQANIVAFNNLYTGTVSSSCPFGPQTPPTTDYTQPTFMWSYAIGTSASFLSPTLSLDGTKVSFIENGNPALFDVLTPTTGQGTDATHPFVIAAAGASLVRLDYTNSAAAGCKASTTNSNSSAYIDYTNDVAYVGADNGRLYKITGVFKGTPAVQYCVTVPSAAANPLLTSPVYDQMSNQVFVSDGFKVYSYTPGAASFTASGSIAVASNAGADPIVLSPIVDTTNGFVYVFSGADSTNTHSIVSQMNLGLTSQVTAQIGPASTQFILDGDFDNAYFTAGPKTGAGTLYACGTQANSATRPSLYALSFSAPNGLMNAAPAMSDNRNINGAANPAGTCSPLLDFDDGTTDRLFVGTGNFNGTTGANLVTEWNVNTRIASNATLPNSTAANEWGGTSAFTIDNVSLTPQAASIYFGTLRPPPSPTTTPCGAKNFCAVKLTQSGLQ